MIHVNRHNVSVAKAAGTICRVAAIAIMAVASLALASCKGRTLHNMVPTGDTVEVNPMPAGEATDQDNPESIDSSRIQPAD